MPTSEHRTKFGRSLRDVVIIASISFALLVPAAEVALRALCAYCSWTERNKEDFVSPYAIREDSWYLVNRKNAVYNYGQPEFDYEVRTNSLGFRDIEHPVAKTSGEIRIMAIGDSFTEGQGALFEQTWVNVLGRSLNRRNGEVQYRMISAGVAGSDPVYGYRILVDKLLVYQPDIVLLVVNGSDVFDVILRGGMERFLADGRTKGIEEPPLTWIYEKSHLVRFLLHEVFDYTSLIISKSERNQKAAVALNKIQDLVLKFDSMLRENGIEFVLVTIPGPKEIMRDRYDWLDGLVPFAEEHCVKVIDAKPHIREKLATGDKRLEELFWPLDYHFTPLGYAYFAEAVKDGLIELGENQPRLAPCQGIKLP